MRSASLNVLALVGLSASLAGCYAPYGYQSPYGPGMYGQPYQPQYPGAPVYTTPPGTPYVPGGTTQPGIGTPTPLTPSNPPSTYDSNNNNGIKFDDAPQFNPNPGTTPGGNSGSNRGTVPDPIDDTGSGPAAARPGLQPTSGTQADDLESPFEESNNSGAPAQPARVGSEQDLFEPPQRLSSEVESQSTTIQRVSLKRSVGDAPNPYGRDQKHANPEWLRGVVDYDAQQRTWQIIYAASPDPRDPNGGSLTLAPHPNLATCRSGDIVLVEGAIDARTTDSRGKPLYAIDAVTPLTAR